MITSENISSLPDKSKEEEVQARREKVMEYLAQCWTEQKIADELGVSKITVVRDVKWLKEYASTKWADEIIYEGFFYYMKKCFDEFEYLKRKLHQFLVEDHTVKEKIMAIKALNDLMYTQASIYAEGPVLQKLKQFVERYKKPNLQNYSQVSK